MPASRRPHITEKMRRSVIVSSLDRRAFMQPFKGMDRVLSRMMIACRALAFRQSVVLVLVMGLVAGPMLNTLTARHAEEAEAAVAGFLLGFSDPGAVLPDALAMEHAEERSQSGDKSSPLADTSTVDHSCHGCSAFVLPVVTAAPLSRLTPVRLAIEPAAVSGRTVPTEIRPPSV